MRISRRARAVTAALVAVVVAGALSACSGGSAGSATPALQVWARPGTLGPDVQQAARKAFPDVRLDFVPIENIGDSLRAALRAHRGLPDVAFLGGDLPSYFGVSDQFLDLNRYGFQDRRAAYFPAAVAAARAPDGTQIMAPTDFGPIAFFYDATAFGKLGLPTDPTAVGKEIGTWSGYRRLAEQVAAKGKVACDSAQGLYLLRMAQQGYLYYRQHGDTVVSDVDAPLNRSAFLDAASYVKGGLCANAAPYSTDWNAAVTRGSVVGFVESAWVGGLLKGAASAQKGDWRIATATPGGPGLTGGSYVGAFASTPHPALAARLVDFFSSAQSQTKAYTAAGLIPSTRASYTDPAVDAPDPFYGGQRAIQPLETIASDGRVATAGPGTAILQTLFNQGLANVAAGADPREQFDRVVQSSGLD